MPSINKIIFALLSVICLTNGEDFCRSYQRNGLRVIITDIYEYDYTLMIIDRNYWKLKNVNGTLFFDPSDNQSANAKEQFDVTDGGNYSYAFIATIGKQEVYVFHKVLKTKFSL